MESTVRGLGQIARGEFFEAARSWLDADAACAANDSAFDPQSAASSTNAGTAHVLLGNGLEAQLRFEAAERSWLRIIDGLATLDIPVTGASSAFHFRLAAKAPDALIDARRSRYRRLAEAALAITRFNCTFAARESVPAPLILPPAAALRSVLSDVLGAQSPDARLLAPAASSSVVASVCALYAEKLSRVQSSVPTLAAAMSEDCEALESAVTLTVVLAPSIYLSLPRDSGNEKQVHQSTPSSARV